MQGWKAISESEEMRVDIYIGRTRFGGVRHLADSRSQVVMISCKRGNKVGHRLTMVNVFQNYPARYD